MVRKITSAAMVMATATLLCLLSAPVQATTLWQDTFTATGNPNTYNVNYNNAARQAGGSIGVVNWSPFGNVQVGNGTLRGDGGYLLVAGDGYGTLGRASLDFNFNNAVSKDGLNIEFDIDPNISRSGVWTAINFGLAKADGAAYVNSSVPHFSLLFYDVNGVAAFDGSAGAGSFTPAAPGVYGGSFSHVRLMLTDPTDGNPFDGVGQTNIAVFTNNGLTPDLTYIKGSGGYANNYLTFMAQPGTVGGIDSLVISTVSPVPEPLTLAAVGMGIAGLGGYTRRRAR